MIRPISPYRSAVNNRPQPPAFGSNHIHALTRPERLDQFNAKLITRLETHFPRLFPTLSGQPKVVSVAQTRQGWHLQTGNTTVTVSPQGNLRYQQNGQDVFLTPQSFDDNDPLKNVLSGLRTDPAPQPQWSQVQDQDWPPPEKVSVKVSPVQLGLPRTPVKGIQIETTLPHGFHSDLKTLVFTPPNEDSVVVASLLSNKASASGHQWAPWQIAPMAVKPGGTPERPNTLVAFPLRASECPKALRTGESTMWHWNPKTQMMQINPVSWQNRVMDKLMLKHPQWSVIAHRGDRHITLVRTTMKHPEQFHVYAGMGHYVELETTGPKVPAGQTSLAVMKFETIPLSKLGVDFKALGQTPDMQAELSQISQALATKIRRTGPHTTQ